MCYNCFGLFNKKKVGLMKRGLVLAISLLLASNVVSAKTDLNCPNELLSKKGLTVLEKGEGFTYPLPEGSIIECYAKRLDGSIDEFEEYNDYFLVRDGKLYSNTMHKLYKPEKVHKLKKVDNVYLQRDGKTLQLYDPLWEWSIRHHARLIKINIQTGEYYMTGTQEIGSTRLNSSHAT